MKYLPVLVVEDDADLREALVDTLVLSGYAVLEAADGQSALQVLRDNAVGLVVSDAQMQPMDGYTLFQQVQASYPALPFVLIGTAAWWNACLRNIVVERHKAVVILLRERIVLMVMALSAGERNT